MKNLFDHRASPETTTSGSGREKLINLLEQAIREGRFIAASKILAKDPSLILSNANRNNGEDVSIAQIAFEFNMEPLLHFGLMNGLSPNAPIFGTFPSKVCLLELAVQSNNLSLLQYGLTFGGTIEKEPLNSKLRGALKGTTCLIETAANLLLSNAAGLENKKNDFIKDNIKIIQLLIDAGATTGSHRRTSLIPVLLSCQSIWDGSILPIATVLRLTESAIKKCDDLNIKIAGTPLICLALGAKNVNAAILLIKSGANTSKSFIGDDIIKIASNNDLVDSIPLITEALLNASINNRATQPALKTEARKVERRLDVF